MRFLIIFGGMLAVLSLLILFGAVLPKIDEYQSQSMFVGALSMFAGEDAQSEWQRRMDALYLMRSITISGAAIGTLLFFFGFSGRKKSEQLNTAKTTRSKEYFIYIGITALIFVGALAYFTMAGTS